MISFGQTQYSKIPVLCGLQLQQLRQSPMWAAGPVLRRFKKVVPGLLDPRIMIRVITDDLKC